MKTRLPDWHGEGFGAIGDLLASGALDHTYRPNPDLRPIGAEFEQVSIPDGTWSGDSTHAHKFRYRVKGHTRALTTAGYITDLEEVDILSVQESKPRDRYPIIGGRIIMDWKLAVDLGLLPPPEFD